MEDHTEIAAQDSSADLDQQILAFGDDDASGDPYEGQPAESESQDDKRRFVEWDAVLPDDPKLPDTYRGKATVSDLWNERTNALQQSYRANQLLNEREAELRTMRATIELLAKNQQQPVAQPEQRQPTFNERAGVDWERELITNPNEAMERYSNAIREELRNELRSEVQAELADLRAKQKNAEAEKFFDVMAQASYAAAADAGVNRDEWNARTKFLMAAIWEQAQDIRAYQDKRWWDWANAELVRTVAPSASYVPGNPGSNTRSAGIAASSKPLPDRFRKLAAQFATDFGVDQKQLEEEIRRDIESGKVR